jgi:hypothetical protein
MVAETLLVPGPESTFCYACRSLGSQRRVDAEGVPEQNNCKKLREIAARR